jgi:hypothetical protein
MRFAVLCLLVILGAACASVETPPEVLGSARVVSDFKSYDLKRVGLLPFDAEIVDAAQRASIESAFLAELGAGGDYEVIWLELSDLAEIPRSEPHRLGRYQPSTIIALARRYRLDGIMIGTLTDFWPHAPMRMSVQVDMVAAETGLAIWSASLHLDTSRDDVRKSLDAWSRRVLGDDRTSTHVSLISPSRLSRFAAWQVAQML